MIDGAVLGLIVSCGSVCRVSSRMPGRRKTERVGATSCRLDRREPSQHQIRSSNPPGVPGGGLWTGKKQVLRYLSRYTRRVAISNRRLVAADDAGVAFRWKDYRIDGPSRWKTMPLQPREFIRRFLLHVLPRGLPPHSPLRLLGQRRPRREHRDGPRIPRCRPAGRRPATAIGYRAGCAAPAASRCPPWRRPHDRHRGRLRAKVAANAEQVRQRHEPDLSSPPPLYRPVALAPRRRRSFSAKPRQSPSRSAAHTLHAPPREIPLARFQTSLRTPSRPPRARFAPAIITGATIKSP